MRFANQKNIYDSAAMKQAPLPKLGVIAGAGELPERIVSACEGMGREVFVAVISGEGNPNAFAKFPCKVFPIGSVGKIIKEMKAEGVKDVVLAGKIKRPSFSSLSLDMEGVKLMARIMKSKLKGDNAVLSTVMKFLEESGFHAVGADSILEDIVAMEGPIGTLQPPDTIAWDDIKFGVKIIRTLGTLDIGQAVVVQQGVTLGIEAIEGTDELIRRTGTYIFEGVGGVLVKLRKPGQENRVDLPTIGVTTVENAAKAGLRGIAVEAGGALVVNRQGIAEAADKRGIFVIGIKPDTLVQ